MISRHLHINGNLAKFGYLISRSIELGFSRWKNDKIYRPRNNKIPIYKLKKLTVMENYDYEDSLSSGLFAGVGLIGCLIYLAILVLTVAGLWKMFEKAGKPGWAAIVPIYNIVVIIEIIGKPLWWILLWLIPCVNIVIGIWGMNLLMKSFGKDSLYTVLALFFPFIIFPVIGFGNDPYLGPSAAEAQGEKSFNQFRNAKDPFDDKADPTV